MVGELKLAQEQAGAEAQLLSSPILLNLRQVRRGEAKRVCSPLRSMVTAHRVCGSIPFE